MLRKALLLLATVGAQNEGTYEIGMEVTRFTSVNESCRTEIRHAEVSNPRFSTTSGVTLLTAL